MSATPSTKRIAFTLGEWSIELEVDENLSDHSLMLFVADGLERAGYHVEVFREHKTRVR